MDDEHIGSIIDNEREWRKHLFKKVGKIEEKLDLMQSEHAHFHTELAKMKVWHRIWRATHSVIFTGFLGLTILWVTGKLNQ